MSTLLPTGAPQFRPRTANTPRRPERLHSPGQAGEDSLTPGTREGWAIRLRTRAGFGWGPPRLAGASFFAWFDIDSNDRLDELAPRLLGVAVYPGWTLAEKRAASVRSRDLSARPVRVFIDIRMRLLP